jgi:hypothetical protein
MLSGQREDYKRLGRLKDCSFLLEGDKNFPEGILRKEMFDILNCANTLTSPILRCIKVIFPKKHDYLPPSKIVTISPLL